VTRRLFGTLCGFVFLVNFGRVTFAPLLETFRTSFDVGPAAVGVVASLVWIGTALPRIPVGYLLTRVSRRRIVLGTGALLVVAAAMTASATSLTTLRVGAFVVGIASGAYYAAAVPLVGDLYPERVGRAVGVHGTAAQLAAVVAPTVAVSVVAFASWREVFWLVAAGGVVVTLAFVVFGHETHDGGAAPDRDFMAAIAHWRVILAGVAMVGAAGFVWQGVFNFYVTYLVAAKGVTQAHAGTLLTVVFAAGTPAFWFSGRLADRLPHVPYVLGIVTAFAATLYALTAVGDGPLLVVVSVALGYAIHGLFPALDAYMLETVPDNRTSAYAVYGGLALFVEATGSGVVGVLTEAGFAFDAVFRVFAYGLLAFVVVLALLYRGEKLPTARTVRQRS
jgi:predicted MFS family arabinose efflux permease